MKKELTIAISIGFVVGLIVTFGIYTANKAIKNRATDPTPLPTNGASAPTPSPASTPNLEITEPENNLVVKKNKVTLSGKTDAKIAVAVLGEGFEDMVLSDEGGLFSVEVSLLSGANEIKVVALRKSGEKEEKVLNIVYTTAKIE
ncbi:hypothetical protein COT75_03325 [Candidatus Beckwithbacteria bacterium CG10_big_fil_rev_8_21_14_0_10_34_10]|uniref:Bacterial Ig domain-containing protein n=1 Tax=Candidatus Beckwithbacteria bacterium CG10_big_fil_rev_8_21_14_0_10_34_10 TaxID=1974495 RepID=A0A2H0WB05_9BACT|nr:MAG: hypothetical protein COT75_03325 [Candidatus Beckwithbacteria bacterium CG10_big_fil_rev_8_21_14_0_10_34_10]